MINKVDNTYNLLLVLNKSFVILFQSATEMWLGTKKENEQVGLLFKYIEYM